MLSVLSVLCCCNKISEAGYFIKKGGSFSSQFWSVKSRCWLLIGSGEGLVADGITVAGTCVEEIMVRQEAREQGGAGFTLFLTTHSHSS
jgi:hypothetical protein